MQLSRAKYLIKKGAREHYATTILALSLRTPDIRRQNITRMVFYPDQKIAFNRIGKSGNSSVVLYLREAIEGKESKAGDYRQSKRSAISLGKELIELSREWTAISTLHRYSFFTVVRNPWTRTLSAFLDKIANGPPCKYGTVPGFGINSREGFEAFVSFLSKGGLHSNHHWKPQEDALLLPPSRFQSICRLENLADELPPALAAMGLTVPDPERLHQPHSIESRQDGKLTHASSRLATYYRSETVQTIAHLFRRDFELGRYSLDPRSIGLHLA